jgi:ankyrin repeat protein
MESGGASGNTVFIVAAENGHDAICYTLLAAGAAVEATDKVVTRP